MRTRIHLLVALSVAACSNSGSGSPVPGSGGSPGTGGSAPPGSGGSAGSAAPDAATIAPGDSSSPEDAAPLPNGGQEYQGIVNLVDPALVAQIEAVLASSSSTGDYSPVTQAFYALYPDEYDFLYLFLDHQPTTAESDATFVVANRPAIPGTGIDTPTALTRFGSRGRLKGVAGFQGTSSADSLPALAHETMHYWGNYLDPALGFGREKDYDYGPHWGLTGVYGQLGGFDPSSVVCLVPDGAKPPDCTLDPDRNEIDYETSAFTPGTNTFLGLVYAPLELYLMGLVPVSELPTSFPVVIDGRFDGTVATIAFMVGTGIGQIATSDIVSRHGNRAPAADSDKHFTAAFVLVTSTPAATDMLDRYVYYQQVWGAEVTSLNGWMSFGYHTGNRANMTTHIGRRRTSADPAPVQ